jgi:small subunit ribosomal protein S8
MTLNDPLADCLSKILNAEKAAKKTCMIFPVSKLIKQVLITLKDNLFMGDIIEQENERGAFFNVHLIGAINNCGAVKPRFAVKLEDFEKFEKRYLPAKGFGFLVVSTPYGIMTNEQAKEKGIGGRLIAYCY